LRDLKLFIWEVENEKKETKRPIGAWKKQVAEAFAGS
jgi:hypothetical protein